MEEDDISATQQKYHIYTQLTTTLKKKVVHKINYHNVQTE